jgi:hypothetical protein
VTSAPIEIRAALGLLLVLLALLVLSAVVRWWK